MKKYYIVDPERGENTILWMAVGFLMLYIVLTFIPKVEAKEILLLCALNFGALHLLASKYYHYWFENDAIVVSHFRKKRIPYSAIQSICITYQETLQKRVGTVVSYVRKPEIVNGKKIWVAQPGVTLLASDEDLWKLRQGGTNTFLRGSTGKEAYLCNWQYRRETFLKLMAHFDGKIYFLKDVYEAFQEEFDTALEQAQVSPERIKILFRDS